MNEGRHASTSPRAKPAAIVGVVAVLAVVALVIVMLATGGKNPLKVITGGGDKPIPEFAFSVTKTQAVPTKSGIARSKLAGKAKSATKAATVVMDDLYTKAFLDPNLWGADTGAFDAFTSDAKTAAGKELTVLTAGPNAADELTDLQPAPSKLSAKVLFDGKGNAYQVMVTVRFTADATLTAGGNAQLVSSGQYFLNRVGSAWKVVSFEVKRSDQAVAAPSPSTATLTGSAS